MSFVDYDVRLRRSTVARWRARRRSKLNISLKWPIAEMKMRCHPEKQVGETVMVGGKPWKARSKSDSREDPSATPHYQGIPGDALRKSTELKE